MITTGFILSLVWGAFGGLGAILRFGAIPALTGLLSAVPLVVKVAEVALDGMIWTVKALWSAIGVFFEKPRELLPLLFVCFLAGGLWLGEWRPIGFKKAKQQPVAEVSHKAKAKPSTTQARSKDTLGDVFCNLTGTC